MRLRAFDRYLACVREEGLRRGERYRLGQLFLTHHLSATNIGDEKGLGGCIAPAVVGHVQGLLVGHFDDISAHAGQLIFRDCGHQRIGADPGRTIETVN
ncbi:hypothetical protein D9M73_90890 [compost metagenome]